MVENLMLGVCSSGTRSLLLSAYAWLTSRQSEASDDSIVHAVVNLLQHGPGFKQAYEQLSSAQQHQIQEAIARARGNNVTAKTHEAPPTIALKLFS